MQRRSLLIAHGGLLLCAAALSWSPVHGSPSYLQLEALQPQAGHALAVYKTRTAPGGEGAGPSKTSGDSRARDLQRRGKTETRRLEYWWRDGALRGELRVPDLQQPGAPEMLIGKFLLGERTLRIARDFHTAEIEPRPVFWEGPLGLRFWLGGARLAEIADAARARWSALPGGTWQLEAPLTAAAGLGEGKTLVLWGREGGPALPAGYRVLGAGKVQQEGTFQGYTRYGNGYLPTRMAAQSDSSHAGGAPSMSWEIRITPGRPPEELPDEAFIPRHSRKLLVLEQLSDGRVITFHVDAGRSILEASTEARRRGGTGPVAVTTPAGTAAAEAGLVTRLRLAGLVLVLLAVTLWLRRRLKRGAAARGQT